MVIRQAFCRCRALLGLLVASMSLGGYGCAQQSGAARGASDASTLRAAGEAIFYQCVACHTVTQGGGSLTGPNLWGVFGSQAGMRPGFGYSGALRASAVVWTDGTMDQFLEKPSAYIPGNAMAFIGLPRDEDRAALIAYLKNVTSE